MQRMNQYTETLDFYSNFPVLIKKVQRINLSDKAKLLSFDVKNLFSSIPIAHLKSVLQKLLVHIKINHLHIKASTELIKLFLDQNYFKF